MKFCFYNSDRFLQSQTKYATAPQKVIVNIIKKIPQVYGFAKILNGSLTSKTIYSYRKLLLYSHTLFVRLLATLGSTKELSAKSCKHIQQQFSSDCELSAKSGPYWIQGILVCVKMAITCIPPLYVATLYRINLFVKWCEAN